MNSNAQVVVGVQNQDQIFLPQDYPDYSSAHYWNARFQREITESATGQEWYLTPQTLFT